MFLQSPEFGAVFRCSCDDSFMQACMRMHETHACIHAYIHACIQYVCRVLYVYLHVCNSVRAKVCTCMYNVCIYIYMYIYIYICVCICV